MSKILVIGAQGQVGTSLVQQLGQQGHQVVKASRQAATAADQVQLDLVSGAGLAQAFQGVQAAFLMAPPGHVNQHELLMPAIDAARAAGVHKLVLMSALGADADEAAPLRRAELHLQASGLAWNVVRPNWFMQNFHTFWLGGIREHGRIFLPLGQARGSFIDTRDIAAVAAELLVSARFDGQAFDLTGSESLDHGEVAAILAQVTGRDIRYQEITPEAMREGLLQAGLPPAYADFMLLILSYFKAGYAAHTTEAVRTVTGQAPRRFAAYAQEFKQAWMV